MARTVWSRGLMLHAGPLSEADRQGRQELVKQRLHITYPTGPSVALRWMSRPMLGFPRRPFQVYRRLRTGDDLNLHGQLLAVGAFAVPANTKWTWGSNTMFDVALRVTLAAGNTLTVVARDTYGEPLPGQRITFSGSGWGRFRAHGIASLGFSGVGTVNTLVGIPQETLVNLVTWNQPIQVVGLPYKAGEAAAPVYAGAMLQGYAPASMTGYNAAQFRLEIAALMQVDPPPVPGVVVSPAWPAPDPVLFLQEMVNGRAGSGGRSFFRAVRACLSQTVDSDPTRQQRDFVVTHELDGLAQVGQNVPPEGTTTFRLPVVGTSMMNVATDSFAATGLGYGTIDLPPPSTVSSPRGGGLNLPLPSSYVRPTGLVDLPHDYMVVAPFHVLAQVVGTHVEWDVELAAIAEVRPEPAAAQSLSASLLSRDRPPSRDTQAYESRRLEWLPSLLPQSYGLVAERAAATPVILNGPRLGGKGYQPYVPGRPGTVEGVVMPGTRSHYVDRYGRQPYSGGNTTRYFVIGTDVFGRWSTSWTQASFNSTADAVARPGVDKVMFEPNPGETGATLHGRWVVDFAWDWGDRSPHTIELTGRFFPGEGVDPDPAPPAGFALTPAGAGTPVHVRFDGAQQPYLASAAHAGHGTVQVLGAVADGNSDVRRYRLILDGGAVDFTASQKKVGYAAYARGSEAVRPVPPAPGAWSTSVGPRVTYVFDPTPPAVDLTPPQVKWTSLPDVIGKARARLTWDGDPAADGYMVWMATESALAKKANLALPEGIQERALLLKDTVRNAALSDDEDSIRVFTRLNEKPLKATEFEADLPGSSGMLFLYRFSAVSKTGVESTRSSEMYAVGVPERVQPGQPVLMARSEPGGIRLTVHPGPGPEADGFRLHRVRREVQARDVGLMGPAAYGHTAPQWQTELVPKSLGSAELVETRVLVDAQAPSWFPFYYRAQALGGMQPDDPVMHGRYPGESEASSVVEVFHTPPAPPSLDFLGNTWVDANDRVNMLTFQTDLPHRLSPLGVALIELYQTGVSARGVPTRNRVLQAKTHELAAQGAFPNPDVMVATVLQAGHLLRFFRSPNNAFPAQYRLYVKLLGKTEMVTDPQTQQSYQRPIWGSPFVLRLVDPLGRATEVPIAQLFNGP
ncbi:Ig-like domain-containing protein [Myxococcus vastator]|uniref:Ig-like domain-containing protein n=1 Tax=Myxococcus vastator TaxID=2709664 RepID=UPI0013D37F76|nr:Ig-like domain-containing protein [Myxococcus vastator]